MAFPPRVEKLTHRIEEFHRLHEEVGQKITAMTGAVLARAFRGEL